MDGRECWLACLLVLAGCPSVSKDTNEGPVPTVEFDPAAAVPIVPFPNNLAIDPSTGRVKLPKQPCESAVQTAVREGELNKLDGFGTYETAMSFTMTAPPDPATVVPANFVMYKIATGTTPVNPAGAQPIPLAMAATKSLRFTDGQCGSPAMVDTVGLVPLVALEEHSTYVVAVKDGLKPMAGGSFYPSPTWALVRQATDPVTVDANGNILAEQTPLTPGGDANDNGVPDTTELLGLNQVWQVHAPALAFLDATGAITSRKQVLVAWTFTTQTTTDPTDPNVPGSPAAMEPTSKLGLMISAVTQAGAPNAAAFLTALGVPCTALPCAAVGDVFAGTFTSPSYQVPGPNPMAGGAQIPGAWTDPYQPTVQNPNQSLQFFATIPAGPAPAGGWPTVIFQHGFTRSKNDMFAIAPQLAAQGFATIAIDIQYHGSRAIRTSVDPTLGCAGTCSTTTTMTCTDTSQCPTGETCNNGVGTPIASTSTPQCYAPILPSDVATIRDAVRQTSLDQQRLERAVAACGAAGCTSANSATVLSVDANKIVYMGHSLGGILGSETTAIDPAFKAAVLNVSGVGIFDILENTPEDLFRCSFVNNLIDTGVLVGDKWDPSNPTVGLCTTPAWKMQPGYQQFAGIARWIVDPGDPANYTAKLATRKFLLQEVVGDEVVPNLATDDEGMLAGQTPATADPATSATPPPSAAITTNPTSSKWVRYPTLPPDAGSGFPGNAFSHGSLLAPAQSTPPQAGQLGTVRVQTDAITFLLENQ